MASAIETLHPVSRQFLVPYQFVTRHVGYSVKEVQKTAVDGKRQTLTLHNELFTDHWSLAERQRCDLNVASF